MGEFRPAGPVCPLALAVYAGREAIATIPDYSTGTVDISNAGTAVTGHSTVFTTTQGDGTYFIQFARTNDSIKSLPAAPYVHYLRRCVPGHLPHRVTYILRKYFYSLSSTADEVLDVETGTRRSS